MPNEDISFNQMLNCQRCNEKFVEPRVLPCGYTVCSSCILSLTNNQSLNCSLCNKIHPIPKEGFPVNQIAFNLLTHKMTDANLIEIYQKLVQLKFSTENSEDHIRNNCVQLRRLVRKRYDQIIFDLNQKYDSLNNQIAACEKDWLHAFNNSDKSQLNQLQPDVDRLHAESCSLLQLKSQCSQSFKNHLDETINRVNKTLYGDSLAEFSANDNILDVDFLGHLCVKASLNLKTMKTFSIDDQLNDFNENIFFANNPNGLFFVAYQDVLNQLVVVTFDHIQNKTEKKNISICKSLQGITKSKTNIAIHLIDEYDQDNLFIMDTNFTASII